jgi:hypothetical protein
MTVDDSPYISNHDGILTAYDSTSLRAAGECLRKYHYQIIEGWQPKKKAPSLHFGIQFHRVMEDYDRYKAAGADTEEALKRATSNALAGWGDFTSDDNRRNKFTLIRTFIWHVDHYGENDGLVTYILANGKPAVEVGFRIPIPLTAPNGQEYIICGHLDKLAHFGEELRVVDYKTTVYTLSSDFFEKYRYPSIQMTLYAWAGKIILSEPVAGVMISGAQTLVNSSRFQRGFADYDEHQFDEFLETITYIIRAIEDASEVNYWPMNPTSCNKYGGCQFRKVCNASPSVRYRILSTEFIREPWNPLKSREV